MGKPIKDFLKDGELLPGYCKTRLYKTWHGMKQRCNSPKEKCFKNYGGRGIKVCEEWERDFLAFVRWATSNGYEEDLTIDRIDVNGNYSPANCRWATQKVQQNHRRNNRVIEFRGEKHTLAEWSDMLGISRTALANRMDISGWSIEKALTTPTMSRSEAGRLGDEMRWRNIRRKYANREKDSRT